MKKTLIIIIILWQGFYVKSQNPPNILWKSIKSDNFKLIFPSDIEPEAQRIVNTLEWVYKEDTKSLNIKPKPIPLILFSKSMTSNAYASLEPRRMGWYLNPPQSVTNLGSMDWAQTLSVHEYRHIVQYAKNKQNFTRFLSFLYGDYGQEMMRWTIPYWFFEGDAVAMETALTNGGRGRMPEFDMEIRTFALKSEKYSYDQAYLGSYKRYYPDHYHLGYPMVANARVNYGNDIWDKVLQRTSKIPFLPFAFGSSLKKYTGINVGQLYKASMADLKKKWETEANELKITEAQVINITKKGNWTNYTNPKYDSKGNIICIKESLKKVPAFYSISPNGSEEKLKNTDVEIFSLNNNIICFDRTIQDIRWNEQSFSDIFEFGLKSNFQKRLTIKMKYSSPSLSPDGKYIAAVEHRTDQKNNLCLIDALTGELLKSYEIGENDYIRTPVWSADGKKIAFTHSKYNGPALSVFNIETEKITKVIDYSFENIGRPVFYGTYILYNSPYSGINNIYAIDLSTGQKYQVTSRPYGAFNADVSPDKTKMVFQDYNKNGFDIAEMELNPEKWIKIEDLKQTEQHYIKKLIEQEGGKTLQNDTIPQISYPVSKYKKFKDAIKIHSWGFFPYVPDLQFSINSNNYLETLNVQAGYLYNINEQTNTGFVGVSYSKYFPVFTIVSSYGQRKDSYRLDPGTVQDEWEEFKNSLTISLPFNFSRNVYYTNLTLRGGFSNIYTQNKENIRRLSDPPNGTFNVIAGGISFSNRIQYAWRDFNPRWGQYISMDYKQIPGISSYKGYLFSARANLFFPGVFPQNSLKFGGSFEKQFQFDENDYSHTYYFSSLSAFPRGFTSYTYDKFYKFTVDYQFPVWYPDLSVGPLAYIKRVRAGVFSDYGKGYWGTSNANYQSFGGSLIFEVEFFRYKYPFEIGLQYSYKYQNPFNEKVQDFSLLIFGLPF